MNAVNPTHQHEPHCQKLRGGDCDCSPTLLSSNERLLLREDGKSYSPDMELSWETFLGNRGAMSPDFWEVARIAYIAAWHASLTYAKRRAPEPQPAASNEESPRALAARCRQYGNDPITQRAATVLEEQADEIERLLNANQAMATEVARLQDIRPAVETSARPPAKPNFQQWDIDRLDGTMEPRNGGEYYRATDVDEWVEQFHRPAEDTSPQSHKLAGCIQDIIDHVLDVANGQYDHEFAVRCELMWAEYAKHFSERTAEETTPNPHVAQSVERRPEEAVLQAREPHDGPKVVGANPSVRSPEKASEVPSHGVWCADPDCRLPHPHQHDTTAKATRELTPSEAASFDRARRRNAVNAVALECAQQTRRAVEAIRAEEETGAMHTGPDGHAQHEARREECSVCPQEKASGIALQCDCGQRHCDICNPVDRR